MSKITVSTPQGQKITRADLEASGTVDGIVDADVASGAAIVESKLALAHSTHAEDHAARHASGQPDALTPSAIGAASAAHGHAGVYEPAGAVATHEGAADPHPTYLTAAEGNAAYEAAGAVAAAIAAEMHPATGHDHDGTDSKLVDYSDLANVPATFPPDAHDHDSLYAPIAKGVTNGDGHDHSGGDGGQIAYASLSGPPTIPDPGNAAEVADCSTVAEADGTSPRFARADHVHLYEAGTPGAHASTHEPGGGDPMAVDAAAATGSLRTLGSGAQEAAAGNHTHGGGVPLISYPICSALVGNQVWTNMPVALSFWYATAAVCKSARRIDLTNYTQVRLRVIKLAVAGAAASKLILRYKAAPWTQTVANYSDIGTSEVSVAMNVTNAFLDTGWIDLAAGAKADVFVALLGSGGDGALDPVFGEIVAEFK